MAMTRMGRWALGAGAGAVVLAAGIGIGVAIDDDSGGPGCAVSDRLVPECGRWWGVAPGVFTDKSTERALTAFEDKTRHPADVVHLYHRDGDVFPTDREIAMARKGGRHRLLFLNWKPEMGRTWAQVAAGDPVVDAHIDEVARRIRDAYPHRFFLAVHHEPEEEVRQAPGSGYTAADYRAMVRHVIKRLRDGGADNAVTVMAYMGVPNWGSKPWFNDLYPGDDVIDWVGADLYADKWVSDFSTLVDKTRPDYPTWPGFYAWASKRFPKKPLMLSEWGTVNRKDDPDFSRRLFASVPHQLPKYPRLKALFYFESPKTPVGDTRWNATGASARAFRQIARMPDFNRLTPP